MTISNQAAGMRAGVCLGTNRPVNPYTGQTIFETDTLRSLVWNGSSWVLLSSASSYSTTSASVWPNFFVYLTGANGSAVANTTIAYNTVLYDDTSSVSSGVFTVPSGQAGVYQFNCTGSVYNIGTSGYWRMKIVIAGSNSINVNGTQTPATNADTFAHTSTLVKLAVGDTVLCHFIVPATGTYSAGINYNTFSGARIR